jgi:Pentapeptide repeats (9 copies)/Pentapeptide repeats (8 copies)
MKIQGERRRLTGRIIEGETLERLDLRGALAFGSSWASCHFEQVRFGQARFDQATFADCTFSRCDFGQAGLLSTFRGCAFDLCDFSQAAFTAAHVSRSRFKKCRFQYATFVQAAVLDVAFLDCDFHGANLDLMVSKNVDWSGSSLWAAVIPINCAFFAGNTFDHDQVQRFLALLLHAKGEWRDSLLPHVDSAARKLVDRLVDEQTQEEEISAPEQSKRDDDGRRAGEPLGHQTMAERDRDRAFDRPHLVGRSGEEA